MTTEKIRNPKRNLKEIYLDISMGIKVNPSEIFRLENYAKKIQKKNWTRYDRIQEHLTLYAIKFS